MSVTTGVGLLSGIDYESIITQMTAINRQPISIYQQRQSVLQAQSDAYGVVSQQLTALRDVLETPKVLGRRLSFEHHIPTHYVDISRASRPGDVHSESASKRHAD